MSETVDAPDWKRRAFELWKLLDNIDTLDDACREDDKQFRRSAYEQQRKRFAIVGGTEFDALHREFANG